MNLSEWDALRQYFVGRSSEIKRFLTELEAPKRNAQILVLYGPAGIGKSSLLQEYMYLCSEREVRITFTDCRAIHSTTELLGSIRAQFRAGSLLDRPFREFDSSIDRLNRLRRAVPELAGESTLPEQMGIEALKGGIGAAVGTAAGMMLAGPAGAIVGGGIGAALGPIIDTVAQRGLNPDGVQRTNEDAEFIANADSILNIALLKGLRATIKKGKVVLFFDNYGQQRVIDNWLCNLALPELVQEQILLVIAGRERPDIVTWARYLPITRTTLLRPFTLQDSARYFRKRGLRLTKNERQKAHEAMAGLPLGIALVADLPQTDEAKFVARLEQNAPDVISRVVEVFIDQIVDDKLRQYVWLSAVPTILTPDVLATIVPERDVAHVIGHLQQYSSLVLSTPTGIVYHDAVRHYLVSEMKHNRRDTYRAASESLSSFYKQKIVNLARNQAAWTIERRQQLGMSRLYHSFEADMNWGLEVLNEEFDAAWHSSSQEFCDQLLNLAMQYFPDTAPDQLILLRGITAIANSVDDETLYLEFNRLYHDVTDLQSKATVGKHLSRLLSLSGRQQQALNCLDECRIMYEECGDTDGAADTVRLMAEVYEELGYSDKALPLMRSITESSASPVVRGVAFFRMAIVLRRQGQLKAALDALRSADECLRSTTASVGNGTPRLSVVPSYTMRENIEILIALGDVYRSANRWEQACTEYTRALLLLQKDRTDEEIQANKELYWRLALIRLNLGACRAVTGQLGEVEPLLTYAITAFVNIKNYTLLTVAYRGAGQYYSFMQQWQKSEYYFFAALDLARTKTQFPRHVAQILISLCELFVAQQLPSRAAQYCHEARTISEEHKYQDLIARQRLCALKVDLLAGDVESVNTVNRLCDVLKAALAYNSYVLDELLADIIQYFSQQVGNGPELLEQLLAFWKNSHQNGRPLAEIDYASRVSDSLDNQVTPTVAEQLERFFDLQS